MERLVEAEGSDFLASQVELQTPTKHHLANTYIRDEEFEKAITLLEQVETDGRALVPEYHDLLEVEMSLGEAYMGTSQHEKAARDFQQFF